MKLLRLNLKMVLLAVTISLVSACGSKSKTDQPLEELASASSIIVNAGPDQSDHYAPVGGKMTNMAASVTNNTNSAIVYYAWKSGSTLLAEGTTASVLTASFHLDQGKHVITLEVTDDQGLTYTDSLNVDYHSH